MAPKMVPIFSCVTYFLSINIILYKYKSSFKVMFNTYFYMMKSKLNI